MCNFVTNDDLTGTMEAIRYFIGKGKKRIGILRGQASHSYDLKEKVYRDFFYNNAIELNEDYILKIDKGNSRETVDLAKDCVVEHFEGCKEPCDAILCFNDFMAVGALNAARALGLKVPEQLSIIGFDNSLVSQITEPALSTVDHHMTELGNTAARRMVQLIKDKDHKESFRKISVMTNLVVRDT